MASVSGYQKAIARAGIIGCGNIGSALDETAGTAGFAKTHAKGYLQNNNFKLAVLCDIDSSRLESAQRIWHPENATTDVDEALKFDLDVVSLCTPVDVQHDLLAKILRYNVPVVFCEKPLGRNLAEARRIAEMVEKSSTRVAVNYIRRYDQEIRKVKSEISGVQKVVCHYGKGLLNNGSHVIDLLIYLFGRPDRIQYVGTVADDRVQTSDPTHEAVLYYDRAKPFCVYLTAQDHRNFSSIEWDIYTAMGRIQILDSGRKIRRYKAETDLDYPEYKSLHFVSESKDGLTTVFATACQEVYELWRGDKTRASSTVQDSLAIHSVIEAIISSKQLKRDVKC